MLFDTRRLIVWHVSEFTKGVVNRWGHLPQFPRPRFALGVPHASEAFRSKLAHSDDALGQDLLGGQVRDVAADTVYGNRLLQITP